MKNANEICDQIFERQYNEMKLQYHQKRAKVGLKVKNETFQERKLAKLEKRVNKKYRLDNSLEQRDTGFTELLNKSVIVDERMVTEEKLKGNFLINISTQLPEPLRIAQFANEPVAFYLHKRRDFLPRLRGKKP